MFLSQRKKLRKICTVPVSPHHALPSHSLRNHDVISCLQLTENGRNIAEETPVIEICVVSLLLLLLLLLHQFVYTDTLEESELTNSAVCDGETVRA